MTRPDPLTWHTNHLTFCEQMAERRHNHPESRDRWEKLALQQAATVEAIRKDLARTNNQDPVNRRDW